MDRTLTERDSVPVFPPATAVGRFELGRELGAGGMGVVYEGHDRELDRRVALKLLAAGAGDRSQLLREARAMARLAHGNVITVFEAGSDRGQDFIAMELIDGDTLRAWLGEPRPWRAIVRAFSEAGRGLAAAHDAGIVHRDFKPSNVLRAASGRIVVSDFGLARARGDAGDLGGTPGYMAPEQWLGEPAGPAGDQFALCVALWEALAGAAPFPTASAVGAGAARGDAAGAWAIDTVARLWREPAHAGRVPRAVRATLRRGLERDPAARWPHIAVLVTLARARARPAPARGVRDDRRRGDRRARARARGAAQRRR